MGKTNLEFTCADGNRVYINPDYVSSVKQVDDMIVVTISGGEIAKKKVEVKGSWIGYCFNRALRSRCNTRSDFDIFGQSKSELEYKINSGLLENLNHEKSCELAHLKHKKLYGSKGEPCPPRYVDDYGSWDVLDYHLQYLFVGYTVGTKTMTIEYGDKYGDLRISLNEDVARSGGIEAITKLLLDDNYDNIIPRNSTEFSYSDCLLKVERN